MPRDHRSGSVQLGSRARTSLSIEVLPEPDVRDGVTILQTRAARGRSTSS
jgi:hypothetical protein